MKKIIFAFILLVTFSIYFTACKDNSPTESPVNPTETTMDSARFSWSSFVVYDYSNGMWARDTNDFYTVNGSFGITHYLNRVAMPFYFGNFQASVIAGFDKDNAFIAGVTPGSDSSIIILKKWTGNEFSDVNISTNFYVKDMRTFFVNPNCIWFTDLYTNKTYRFNGSTISRYSVDIHDSDIVMNVYYDSVSHTERAVTLKDFDPHNVPDNFKYSVYDFNGSGWVKTNEFIEESWRNSVDYISPQFINGYFLAGTNKALKIYNGGLVDFIRPYNFSFGYVNGYSRKNIFATPKDTYGGIFNWNGTRWSREPDIASGVPFYLDNNTCIIVTYSHTSNASTFVIGRRRL